jgi:hypothetical protein
MNDSSMNTGKATVTNDSEVGMLVVDGDLGPLVEGQLATVRCEIIEKKGDQVLVRVLSIDQNGTRIETCGVVSLPGDTEVGPPEAPADRT